MGMFDEIEGCAPRQQHRLKTYDPTDCQAEVLVFDVIEPSLVYAAAFQTETAKSAYSCHFGSRQLLVQPQSSRGYFDARTIVR
jgi:hypothetical protein